jgi:uncharacterized membrane protein (DUF373 family)
MSVNKKLQHWAEQTTRITENAVVVSEVLIAVMMAVLIGLGVIYLVVSVFNALSTNFLLDTKHLISLVDIALIVFIVIELFRITLAYITGDNVIPTVIEAAFVAIGRKVVLYDFKTMGLNGAISMSMVLLAVTAAYFLTREQRPKVGAGAQKPND